MTVAAIMARRLSIFGWTLFRHTLRIRRSKRSLTWVAAPDAFPKRLRARFGADVIGIDPSKRMLEQARSKPHDRRILYELGRGESIPLPDNSVDLIFMSMIFHHLDNPALAAREGRRVLRDQGTAFLRAGTRERISSYPYVEFFPESRR